jgi:nicotinate-nucleotide pyrophosphorylase (carboxylating)
VTAFNPAEEANCQRLVAWALDEDLREVGDMTSDLLIPQDLAGQGALVARSAGVVAGLPAVALVVRAVDPELTVEMLTEDGARVEPGSRLAILRGRMHSLLVAERTALNFLQRLSGIASLTRRYVETVAGLPAQVLDTRKTTPGWRFLERYAVRCGGGRNHRFGLCSGILIKDNHLAALGGGLDAIRQAIATCREEVGSRSVVEVEVDDLQQFDVALECRAGIILLDNMTVEDMREAIRRRDAVAPGVLLEASGGVTLQTIRSIAETGVDRISVGALTHSAPALDIGLDYYPGRETPHEPRPSGSGPAAP